MRPFSHNQALQVDQHCASERLRMQRLAQQALTELQIDLFAIQIHDGSFPVNPEEDCGRGSPYSYGAERFFHFAASLGFNVVQLGPSGKTLRGNASPYDGTIFSRNPLSLPLGRYADNGRISQATLQQLRLDGQPSTHATRLSHTEVHDRYQIAIQEIVATADATDFDHARQFLSDNQWWLVPDALYDALSEEYGSVWWPNWKSTSQASFDQKLFAPDEDKQALADRRLSELQLKYEKQIRDYALIQWLIEFEHHQLRERLKPLGIQLFADLQVGLSPQDVWARQTLFHKEYLVGAPPSRTNSQGQPWGFGVLDPEKLGTPESPGPGMQFVQARLHKALNECDGVRIDHPQGWIDPWVYRSDDPDPIHAVQNGARLFSSPADVDHPALRDYAIARTEQINRSELTYADHRVQSLDDSQVAKYSWLIDVIAKETKLRTGSFRAIACEILSTLPYPVQRVLDRYKLGRFRVVQKANLDNPADVYRIENANPQDWIMFGTHDTPTIWEVVNQWCQGSAYQNWEDYLLSLGVNSKSIPSIGSTSSQSSNLIHMMMVSMLASKAKNMSIFFPDLFGFVDRYNEPGLVSEKNWRLQLPHDFEDLYALRCQAGAALDVASCLKHATTISNAARNE
ncbi:MAG: 4-alpha-glucanotransferase [Pirellulaceae bacterium]|nr:4-alpha-glucanotransferase [Pirellulaceae bacterium]